MNNVWDAATSYVEFSVSDGKPVKVTFTPSGGNKHVYLNGFELDGPSMDQQIAFPFPENHNEHIELGSDGTIEASWRAAPGVSGNKYNVYLGTSVDELHSVGDGLEETSVTFTGKPYLGSLGSCPITNNIFRPQCQGHFLLAS